MLEATVRFVLTRSMLVVQVELQVYRQGKDGAAEREKEVRHLKSEVGVPRE
jgi:hypothetical protein